MATFYFLSWGLLGNLDGLILDLNWEQSQKTSVSVAVEKKECSLKQARDLQCYQNFVFFRVLLAIRFKSWAGDLVVGTKSDFTVGSDINQTLEVNNSSELLLVFPPHLHNWYKLVCDLLGVRNVLSQVLFQIR